VSAEGYLIEPYADPDADAVIALWERERAMPEAEARRRAHEVVLVARAGSGDLAGVSSAFLKRQAQLRMDLWHGRVFVAAAHRRGDLASLLILRLKELLRDAFVTGRETRAAGMCFEVENPILKGHLDLAVWRRSGFTFIGENERGDHVRVLYFPGAKAPLP
jgi:GNAT superfamily N-acetyltransferase